MHPSPVIIAQRWVPGPLVEVLALVHQGGNAWQVATGTYNPVAGQNALGCAWVGVGVTGTFASCMYYALDTAAVQWALSAAPDVVSLLRNLQDTYTQIHATLKGLHALPA